MKKSKKNKRKIFLALAAVVIAAVLMFFLKGNSKEPGKDNENVKSVTGNETREEKLKVITVSPDKITLKAGEKIELSLLKIEAVYESGKTEEIKKDLKFTTDSSVLNIEGGTLSVPENAKKSDSETLKISYGDFSKSVNIIIEGITTGSNQVVVVSNPDDIDALVNRKNELPGTYVPNDLKKLEDVPTVLNNPEVNQLRQSAYDALKELFKAALDEKGFELYARSGYRSYNTQDSLYNSYVSSNGQEAADKFSAKPGQSEHQTGLAIDITSGTMNFQLSDKFGETEEGKWVSENADRFGFIVRYPKGKEDITGYMYEPWHLRFVGKELAGKIKESRLTMDEYFSTVNN
jgi:D-alanyl-D-alanine carboxypeptidase